MNYHNAMGKEILVMIAAIGIAVFLGFSGSQEGLAFLGWPIFAFCIALIFIIQWVAFVPAATYQTEHFYDLVGSMSYLSVVLIAFFWGHPHDLRSQVTALLVTLWACRLGLFLFLRVRQTGRDERFDSIKKKATTFLMAWTLQGLWVSFTVAAALAILTSQKTVPLDGWFVLGLFTWLFGFIFEVIADDQKRRHRLSGASKRSFVSSGLWAWSRHPNYFGEIVVWVGIAFIAFPVVSGWQLVTLLSPLFVYLLITRVSGIPILEAKAEKKWGAQKDYQAYKKRTPLLFPLPFFRS